MINQKGFTLIELMVALAVFAVTATVTLQHSSRALRIQKNLQDTSFATWIAQNQLSEIRNSPFAPSIGEFEKDLTYAKRQWHVLLTTERSLQRNVLKTRVTVSSKEKLNEFNASLTGYYLETTRR